MEGGCWGSPDMVAVVGGFERVGEVGLFEALMVVVVKFVRRWCRRKEPMGGGETETGLSSLGMR